MFRADIVDMALEAKTALPCLEVRVTDVKELFDDGKKDSPVWGCFLRIRSARGRGRLRVGCMQVLHDGTQSNILVEQFQRSAEDTPQTGRGRYAYERVPSYSPAGW